MSVTTVLDGLLDPLSRCLDPESARRFVELRVAPPVQERIDALAERSNEGLLTDDHRARHEALITTAVVVPSGQPTGCRKFGACRGYPLRPATPCTASG